MGRITSELLERAFGGDRGAQKELICILTPILHARVARVLSRRRVSQFVASEVEDLVQKAYLALLEKDGHLLWSWKHERGMSFENFAGLIAEQQAAATFRVRSGGLWLHEPSTHDDLDIEDEGSPTPERIVAAKEVLRVVLEQVKAEQSDLGLLLFHLLIVDQRPSAEVCRIMDLSANRVHQWHCRLRKRAREILLQVLDGEKEDV